MEGVVEVLAWLRCFGVHSFHVIDDSRCPSRAAIGELCGRLHDACPGLKKSRSLPVNLIDGPTGRVHALGRLPEITLGSESGNDGMLRRMGKQIAFSEGFAAAETVRQCGIVPDAFFPLGAPDETEETPMDTCRSMKRFRGGLVLSVFARYLGTETYEYGKVRGLIGQELDTSDCNLPSPMNHFCPGVSGERLTTSANEVFHYVERHNALHNLRHGIAISSPTSCSRPRGRASRLVSERSCRRSESACANSRPQRQGSP